MAEYKIDIPEYYNMAVDVVDKWAADRKHRAMMFVDEDYKRRDFSFRHFSERSQEVALAFSKLGIGKGDRVMMVLPRLPEWWEIFVGLTRMGAIPVPCTTLLVHKDLEYRAKAAEVVAFVGDSVACKKLDKAGQTPIRHKICVATKGQSTEESWQDYHKLTEPFKGEKYPFKKTLATDGALLYFTSGTTGNPKMVLHDQISYGLGHILTGRYWLRLDSSKVYWNLSEQGWAKAGWSVNAAWTNGATLFVQDSRGPFDTTDTLKTLHDFPITTLCAPPTAYRPMSQPSALAYMKANPPMALKHCTGAGEPLNAEVVRTWQTATGIEIKDGYGQTETISVCGNGLGVKVKLGSMGLPTPGITLAVIDDEGHIIQGREGDVAVLCRDRHGKHDQWIFKGYWKPDGSFTRPERQEKGGDRVWYTTGDRAYTDTEGYFWFVGRSDDVINSCKSCLHILLWLTRTTSWISYRPFRGRIRSQGTSGCPGECRGQLSGSRS